MDSIRDIVLKLHREGYSMIPSGKGDDGKHPAVEWKPYQKGLPPEDVFRSWLRQENRKLWGIVAGGGSGVVIVDCDPGADQAIMDSLEPHVKTPRGGSHYWFEHPGKPVKTCASVLPKIDIRGDGGFANVVGVNPKTGGHYDIKIMPTRDKLYKWDRMPKPILEAMEKRERPEVGAIKALDGVPEGERDVDLYKYACRLFGKGLARSEVMDLVVLAGSRCDPSFSKEDCLKKVESAAKYEKTGKQGEPPEIVSAKDLMEMDFPPLKWALEGWIVEGLGIVTAKPKAGKGRLMLEIAYSVALGRDLLDGSPCEKGRVLYMGLEDSLRRLRKRVDEINDSLVTAKVTRVEGGFHIHANIGKVPDGFDLTTKWPRIEEGCIEYLEKYLDDHPDTRLIIIDIFKRIAKAKKGKISTYDEEYESLQPLQELATRRRVPIYVVHHNRKAIADDPMEMVSGTFGVTAGVDSVIVIQKVTKGEIYDESKFSFFGRDIDEKELAMQFNKRTYQWSLLGDAAVHFIKEEQKVILELLEHETLGPKEVAERLDMKEPTAKSRLWRMAKAGLLVNDGGKYRTAGR